MICKMTTNSFNSFRECKKEPSMNWSNGICPQCLDFSSMLPGMKWLRKFYPRTFSSNYISTLIIFALNLHLQPICTGSISILRAHGSRGISGRIYSIWTKCRSAERPTIHLKKSGPGRSSMMLSPGSLKNNVWWS